MIPRKLVCLLALGLAACNSSEPPTNPAQSKSATPKQAMTTGAAPEAQISALDRALAATKQALHVIVRYDHVKPDSKGRQRRQVFLEVVQSTAEQDVAVVTQALEAAGFKVKAGKVDDKGRRLLAHIKGAHTIDVLIRNKDQGPKLKDPAAVSSISLREWLTATPKVSPGTP